MRIVRLLIILGTFAAIMSALSALGLAATGRPAPPEPVHEKVYRIGFLTLTAKVRPEFDFPDIQQRLGELGYVEGRDYIFEERHADNDWTRLPALAEELVQLDVDIILAATLPAIQAAQATTTTIPIVMTPSSSDPVADKLIVSLARPGGNITGMANSPPQVELKRLQVLKEALPNISRVLVLGWPSVSPESEWFAAADMLGVELIPLRVGSVDEIPTAISSAMDVPIDRKPNAMIVVQKAYLSASRPLTQIAELAIEHQLPSIAPWGAYTQRGGFLSYEARAAHNFRLVGDYIDWVRKGHDPAGLPVRTPQFYDLAINRATQKALGVAVDMRVLPGAIVVDAPG